MNSGEADSGVAEMRRGANVGLTREIPGLRSLVLGASWNAGSEHALDDNLVFAALLCTADGRVRDDQDFVFFNQIASSDLSVQQLDHVMGSDNAQIEVELAAVPPAIDRIVLVLYVNDGPAQRRTLGQLRSCIVRVLNLADNAELVRSEELAAAFNTETAVALGEVYRHGAEWKFKVLGQGYSKGILGIAADYGISL
ncbi:MAG: TerD family protein [Jatrophihabitans sp.]